MTISDIAYERSCRIALECGYREVITHEDDKRAYRGSYFVKKGKLWIHDIVKPSNFSYIYQKIV